jgi:LacI family transcriptional regulator
LSDVAALAGVSSSTASRALTDNGYAAPDVRKRVAAAADKLGYVPDANARGLKAQATRTVGLLVSDLRNSFYAEVAAGAASVLREQDYTIVLVDDAASDREEMAAARTFLATRVAGVLLTPLSATVTEFVSRHGLPVVEIDRQFSRGRCDAVLINNVKAANELTSHLLSLGHRRIALVIDETDWTTGKGRLRGYVRALEQAGLKLDESLVLRCGLDLNEVSDQTRTLLTARRRPTAVFTANNLLAELVWRQAHELGLSIPGDLSFVAFDDSPWMSMVSPGITTIRQPAFELGSRAAELLLSRIAEPAKARTVSLGSELVERGSVARPGRRRTAAKTV